MDISYLITARLLVYFVLFSSHSSLLVLFSQRISYNSFPLPVVRRKASVNTSAFCRTVNQHIIVWSHFKHLSIFHVEWNFFLQTIISNQAVKCITVWYPTDHSTIVREGANGIPAKVLVHKKAYLETSISRTYL